MSAPIPLPEPIKRIARRARSMPSINRPVTRVVKLATPFLPKSSATWLQDHFPRVGRTTAAIPGGGELIIQSDEPEFFVNRIYYGDWTAGEPDITLWHRLAKRADLILDIGAHIGHYALVAAAANPSARVLAFEPLPRIARALRGNVSAMALKNITVSEIALSNTSGTATFFAIPDGMPSSSSLSKTFMEHGDHSLVETPVKTDTIDALKLGAGHVTLVKIDTETTEDDVIRGGRQFFVENKPIIFIEVLDTMQSDQRIDRAILDTGVGYVPYLLTASGPVRKDRIVADESFRNYLLMPPSGPSYDALKLLVDITDH